MASPESAKKSHVRPEMVAIDRRLLNRATDQANTTITTVRMAVARLESTPRTPTFASMAVSPAKNADSSAQTSQFMLLTPTPQVLPQFGHLVGEARVTVIRRFSFAGKQHHPFANSLFRNRRDESVD